MALTRTHLRTRYFFIFSMSGSIYTAHALFASCRIPQSSAATWLLQRCQTATSRRAPRRRPVTCSISGRCALFCHLSLGRSVSHVLLLSTFRVLSMCRSLTNTLSPGASHTSRAGPPCVLHVSSAGDIAPVFLPLYSHHFLQMLSKNHAHHLPIHHPLVSYLWLINPNL